MTYTSGTLRSEYSLQINAKLTRHFFSLKKTRVTNDVSLKLFYEMKLAKIIRKLYKLSESILLLTPNGVLRRISHSQSLSNIRIGLNHSIFGIMPQSPVDVSFFI